MHNNQRFPNNTVIFSLNTMLGFEPNINSSRVGCDANALRHQGKILQNLPWRRSIVVIESAYRTKKIPGSNPARV
jgi:hypothetical protein